MQTQRARGVPLDTVNALHIFSFPALPLVGHQKECMNDLQTLVVEASLEWTNTKYVYWHRCDPLVGFGSVRGKGYFNKDEGSREGSKPKSNEYMYRSATGGRTPDRSLTKRWKRPPTLACHGDGSHQVHAVYYIALTMYSARIGLQLLDLAETWHCLYFIGQFLCSGYTYVDSHSKTNNRSYFPLKS